MSAGMRGMVAAVAMAAVLLASQAHAAAPTRDAYIKKVDPICKRLSQRLNASVREFEKAVDKGKIDRAAEAINDAARTYRGSFRKIKRVEPPAADARTIDRWLRLVSRDVRNFRNLAEAFDQGRYGKIDELVERTRRLAKRMKSQVGNYGFRHCA